MGKLPKLPLRDDPGRVTQTAFGGYDHSDGAYDGAIYDMTNLSSRSYPLLATRKKRVVTAVTERCRGVVAVGGDLCWVDGGTVRRKNRVLGAVTDSPKNFAVLGSDVLIFPDAVAVSMAAKGAYTSLAVLRLSVRSPEIGDVYAVGVAVPADLYTWDGEDWVFLKKEIAPLAASVRGDVTFRAEGSLFGVAAGRNTLHSDDVNWADYFAPGDGVTISGCVRRRANNKTAVIREIDGGDLRFYEDTFAVDSFRRYVATGSLRADYYTFSDGAVPRYFALTYAMSAGDSLLWDGSTLSATIGGVRRTFPVSLGERGSYLDFVTVDGDIDETDITVSRRIPAFDHVTAVNNRLWGCAGDTIYGSKLGDAANFSVFDGLATDSYAVRTGTPGAFTACCDYLGYPTFFKEDRVFKVYGSKPADFSLVATVTAGVAAGSAKSLAVAGDLLFYLSPRGVMAFGGALPVGRYDAFGGARWRNGVGGSDGARYYISMSDGEGSCSLFVYDTAKDLWHREDSLAVSDFWVSGGVLFAAADERFIAVSGGEELPGAAETSLPWEAVFGDFYAASPDQKSVTSLTLRLSLEEGSTARVWFKGENGEETALGTTLRGGGIRTVVLPVHPGRCDRFRLRVAGTGPAALYSLAVTYRDGSDVPSRVYA